MSEISQTYLAMVRREHQPVTGLDRAICGRCGAVDRREGYPCAALVLLDAIAAERARAEAAEQDARVQKLVADVYQRDSEQLRSRLLDLEGREARLREALVFYSSEESWDTWKDYTHGNYCYSCRSAAEDDCGARARIALAGTPEVGS